MTACTGQQAKQARRKRCNVGTSTYEPKYTLDDVDGCPVCLRYARTGGSGTGRKCPAHEPTTCTCEDPQPLGASGVLGWSEHVCSTCMRPILSDTDES